MVLTEGREGWYNGTATREGRYDRTTMREGRYDLYDEGGLVGRVDCRKMSVIKGNYDDG
eukprot:CAMPEP_0178564426 /NCGR_PEP_ID=MMETSP0697-20121206/13620_1 /TAXON_ID=265572 /ORGANISM="Extubocellulus spinifer, Strain CCMP396" /LENGTH=58 /DNA_ID=CAMNT_0020197961 /DNA_START=124 /DNA_END=298 /DNA_ORIENTATION=-